jgi:pyruvate dehydrogenase E2 component (dihydrolipoamide acetyltransferase)
VTELTMPKLSDSMEQGTILTWLKTDGEHVNEGDELVEIETDKATVTHIAEASGFLKIVAAEGTSLAVGATIARLVDSAPREANGARSRPAATAPPLDASPISSSGLELDEAAAAPANRGGGTDAGSVRATPLARRIARSHGVALEDVPGSGPAGRITRADVLRKANAAELPSIVAPASRPANARDSKATSAAAGAEPPSGGAKGHITIIEPNRLQTVVARRMAEAKATIPHFQVQTEVQMDAATAFRAQIKDTGADAVPSLNDMIVKAAAVALRLHPLANGAYRGGHFEQYGRVNVGIAVAGDGTLAVPTIFDADTKSLGTIAAEARRLASAVRDGSVSPAELSGATFTISNLGMYGVTAVTPVINSPQAAILGVGAVRQAIARAEGKVVDCKLMTLTLSCDHRILYGTEAAEFLSDVRQLLERPLRLVL